MAAPTQPNAAMPPRRAPVVLITRDKNGLYVELMGEDPAVEATLIAVLGKPSPALAAELERLWKAEWRQGN